jgi:hypothetical protein
MASWRLETRSWSEFVDVALNGTTDAKERYSRNIGDSDWSGTRTWEEVKPLCLNGWPEVAERIEKLSSRIQAVVSQHINRPEVSYAYEGLDYDIGRLLDGEPEHWLTWNESDEIVTGHKTVCRILYNICVSSGISTESMIAKGAGIAALVRALDYAGIRAEVVLYSAVVGDPLHKKDEKADRAIVMTTVKQAGQDMDFPTFSYAMAHPSVFRRLVLSIEEQAPRHIRQQYGFEGGYYGYPADTTIDESAKYDIHIGRSYYGEPQWSDTDATVAWVLTQLKAQGVSITGDSH